MAAKYRFLRQKALSALILLDLSPFYENLIHGIGVVYSIITPAAIIFRLALGAGMAENAHVAVSAETKIEFETNSNIGMGNNKKNNNLDYALNKLSGKKLHKVNTLEEFFHKYNSPLKSHADTFVEVAEKYDLDFKLLPAISCIESSCGRALIPGSYNPFGWGIYGSNAIYFSSYDEAIEEVGKGLKENYLERGLDTPEKIAPVYTPPRPYHWLGAVNQFMGEMEEIEVKRVATETVMASSIRK